MKISVTVSACTFRPTDLALSVLIRLKEGMHAVRVQILLSVLIRLKDALPSPALRPAPAPRRGRARWPASPCCSAGPSSTTSSSASPASPPRRRPPAGRRPSPAPFSPRTGRLPRKGAGAPGAGGRDWPLWAGSAPMCPISIDAPQRRPRQVAGGRGCRVQQVMLRLRRRRRSGGIERAAGSVFSVYTACTCRGMIEPTEGCAHSFSTNELIREKSFCC